MADDSDIVYRWEINNATARFATGKVESEVFKEGGFKWIAAVERCPDASGKIDVVGLALRCNVENNALGMRETEVDVVVRPRFGSTFASMVQKKRFFFDGNNNSWHEKTAHLWNKFAKMISFDDTITIEFTIRFISAVRTSFSGPTDRSNVILKIEDKMVHVSKEYLSVHSSYFEALFYGQFTEKGDAEVEMSSIDYEEFLVLLRLLYLKTMKITDSTVLQILKLADYFQIECLLNHSEKHLMQSSDIDVIEKLLLANQCNLVSLRDHCLQSFTKVKDLAKNLKSIPEFDDFSPSMKAAMCDRFASIANVPERKTDDSKIVIRWEINNATERFETGKVESEVFDEGGFKWAITMDRNSKEQPATADFTLKCGVNHNGYWKCEARVKMYILRTNGKDPWKFYDQKRFSVNESNASWTTESDLWWSAHTDSTWSTENYCNTIILKFRLQIISSERGEPIATFSAPSNMSNVILKIGNSMLHVNKEYLSVHSPAFATLFSVDFAGKEEVEIKDVTCEELRNLLNVLYLKTMNITDRTVLHILKLASRFKIERLVDESKQHLIQSEGFDNVQKLRIADQYKLVSLRDHCLQSFSNAVCLSKKLKLIPEYDKFSFETRAAICDRIIALSTKSSNTIKTIANMGYCFQDGKLRTIKGDQGFTFTTQKAYEELGEQIDEFVYDMIEGAGLERRYVKIKELRRFYFVSPGYEEKERILVIVNGCGVPLAGQWTRKLIINESLDRGSQLPYIRRALDNEWGVVVLNHNKKCEGREKCHTFESHGRAEWKHALAAASDDSEVVVVAHGQGGKIVSEMCDRMSDEGDNRLLAVALTGHKFTEDHNVFVANWSTKKDELNENDAGCYELYSGDSDYLGTSASAINSIFAMLEGVNTEMDEEEFHDLLEECEKIIKDENSSDESSSEEDE